MTLKPGFGLAVAAIVLGGPAACSQPRAAALTDDPADQLVSAGTTPSAAFERGYGFQLGAGDACGGEVYSYYLANLDRQDDTQHALVEVPTDLPED